MRFLRFSLQEACSCVLLVFTSFPLVPTFIVTDSLLLLSLDALYSFFLGCRVEGLLWFLFLNVSTPGHVGFYLRFSPRVMIF